MTTNEINNHLSLKILYELIFYSEWNQETDVKSLTISNQEKTSATYKIWPPWDYKQKNESLIDGITNLKNCLLGWHFAVGDVESVLAILQDTLLEIRTPCDDFSSLVGKAAVARDNHPQWRRVCWSPDCSVLAVASSQGVVTFYDLLGSSLFTIPLPSESAVPEVWEPEHSLAGMFFINTRVKNQKWPFELILVDYGGNLRSYYVSPTEGFFEFHKFSLDHIGVSSVSWDPSHNLIIASSVPNRHHHNLKDEPLGWGLSAWRLLNEYPYYHLTTPSPEDLARAEANWGLSSWISSFYKIQHFSVVFKTAVSPDGTHLGCIHTCGSVSIWFLPSFRLQGVWRPKEQPDSFSAELHQQEDHYPVDISWWAKEKVMIARKNGAVSVCELTGLRNMLGETPEFLHGEPSLSPFSTQKGVLVLECETDPDEEYKVDVEPHQSMLRKSSAVFKRVIYWLTDMERFQPKRIKPKMQQRTYRLLGIKSTTPDELFRRKIEAGEFEEALHLAELYNLDTDRVYQRQWRNSPVSEMSISAYLSKISKKRWVFEECIERVPDTLSAAKKLLEFGLQVTCFAELLDLDLDNVLGAYEHIENSCKDGCDTTIQEYLLTFPVEKLSEHQKSLIRTRKRLLRFSDRLFTYEKIINSSNDAFSQESYNKFRRLPVVFTAIELSRKADSRAVGLILTYQGQDALPYWLTILSNFPETISPATYNNLLPECSDEGVFRWEERKIREEDWCENTVFDEVVQSENTLDYDLPQRDEHLTAERLSEWYRNRIYELELLSNMVAYPLELARLAKERNVKGLDGLINELVTLDVLVYDVGMEDISLRDLQIMSPLQKAQVLMDKANEESFVEHIRHRLLPYLQRCEKLQAGTLKELLSLYLTDVSSRDLKCPLKVFEFCAAEPWNSIVQQSEELYTLALESVYAYPATEQLDTAEAILRTLPVPFSGVPTELSGQVETALNELNVAMILRRRGHVRSLRYIKDHRHSLDTAKPLFLDLATDTATRRPVAGESEWNELLQDILLMQSLVFTCVPVEFCHEVYVAGVLASSSTGVIRTAVRSLCCHSEERDHKPLSLLHSVQLVSLAAVHHFDSAESLTDGNITLAKACLNLITEDNEEIQEEKDLIAALQSLSEFKVTLLPMQVRLCTDRMRLVESCLASRPTAYKDYHKLLSLAHKLRICGNDSRKREATILVHVSDISFEAGDLCHCAEICQQLMERRHGVGWMAAQRLALSADFPDLAMKKKLIAFALIHCPDTNIYELLDTRCDLEYQRLQQYMRDQACSTDTASDDEEFIDAVASPQTPTKEFLPQLSTTILNTSKIITQLTKSGFWKEKPLYKDSKKEVAQIADVCMGKQGFPEFYWALHGRRHLIDVCSEGQKYQLIQALLRASLLGQEKLPVKLRRDIDNVLIQFASLLMPEDCCVGLTTLLALSHPQTGDQSFSNLPLTLLTLQLTVYWLALLIALQHHQSPFFWTPDQVLAWVLTHSKDSIETKLLNKALTQLANFQQSKQVEQLNAGVDVRRFAWDTQYKVDSILGLAMCEECGKLQAALELGTAHGVEGWEIVVSHVRVLLISNSALIAQRLSDNRLIQLLRDNSSDVVMRLQEVVLPSLSGVSYNQLISYYTVLNVVAADTQINGLLPKDHIKLIKKVKATSPDIDYVRLITKPNEIREVLKPSLKKDTIALVAKLMKELLKALPLLQPFVSVSGLYLEWTLMQFKEKCLSANCRNPLEQFGSLLTCFQKMSGPDLLLFVKKTLFFHQAIIRLGLENRVAMLDVVVRVYQQQPNSYDDSDYEKIRELRGYLQQVWALDGASLSCKSLRSYLLRLDEGCGDPEAVSTIVQTALVDASLPSHVLRSMAQLSNKKSLSSHVTSLLHVLPSHPSLITTILERVEDCLAHGEKQDSWSILIGPISDNTALPASVRKHAAQISHRLGANYSEELEALRMKAEAVLRRPIELSQVSDHNSRYMLYKEALSKADCYDTLHSLCLLLTSWPDVDTSWYLELIEVMSEIPNEKVYTLLGKIFRKITFEQEEIEHLLSRIETSDNLFKIALCLNSHFKHSHLQAVEMLSKLPENTTLPLEIARRVVELGYTPDLANTPVFSHLMKTLTEGSADI